MALRPEVVRQRLDHLLDTVARLAPLLDRGGDSIAADPPAQWQVERGVHLAAEAILDVGAHLLSAQFAVNAAEYADIVPTLVRQGVLSAETGSALDRLAGLRNLLVHRYTTIDHRRLVREAGDALPWFRRFEAEMSRWLDGAHP